MTTALIYDPLFLRHETGFHPENAERLQAIYAALEADYELQSRVKNLLPTSASDEDLLRCHGEPLLAQVRTFCERNRPFIDLDTVICPQSFQVAKLAAGAAITAVDEVCNGASTNAFAYVRPPGHHATANRSMGFCLFNNAAIGARYAQARYGVERVLIIDWDVHHGNGTQDIFYQDPTVFYFSTHQFPYYPGTGAKSETGDGKGAGTTLNIPLPEGTAARPHREAFTQALQLIEHDFPPDLIIISAGFDSRRDDPLGGLRLEDTDFAEMTKEVMEMADRHAAGRVVSLLEGGYNLNTLGETVRVHVNALAS
ncbi:MAG: histone deacetylase [Acidobacteria bacterium]|nr:histone deacetylase [Acidobacteriota bacterium]